MTRNFATLRLLCLMAGTCAYAYYGLEFMTGSPAYEVWAWWWRHGEGKLPILLCLIALLAFPFTLSLWIDTWSAVAWGETVDYVFLGPTLERDKNRYYALDDPTRQRLEIRLPSVPYGRTLTSRVDDLLATHKMLRLGPDLRQVDIFLGHNTRSRSLSALMHYVLLFWGLAALSQVILQYREAMEAPLPIPHLLTVIGTSLIPLMLLHLSGLASGHLIARKRFGGIAQDAPLPGNVGLKPGDRVTARLVATARQGKKNLRKRFFLVEWPARDGLMVSAVIAFYLNRKIKAEVQELEQLTRNKSLIDCSVTEQLELRPLLFTDPDAIDWY